jgi:ABC-type dipeptide/oligopeptide/nickel transport system permease component
MIGYALRRLLVMLPLAWLAITLVFLLLHLIPGDPVLTMLGEGAQAADVAAMRARLGLDRPLGEQYLSYFGGLLRGDLGRSLQGEVAISQLLARHYPATLLLACVSLGGALALAIPLGVAAALRPGGWLDQISRLLALASVSLPTFWLGPVLILVFAIGLGWLPVGGRESPASVILPAATLGAGLAGMLLRMVRAAVAGELAAPYVLAARARGLGPAAAAFRHALRNALIPVVTVVGLQFGSLLTGSIITETIFSWPGLGRLLIQAIRQRDYPLVQAAMLVIVLTYLIVNLLSDLLAAALDPRVRGGLMAGNREA